MTRPIAVIDVETTGINPHRHDRIIELAAVIVTPEHGVIREFESLVNPHRDIGPISIHGLTTAQVRDAPTFAEIAGPFVESVEGCAAIGGHNVRFDLMFLQSEFARIGNAIDDIRTICSMRLAGGGTLVQCCEDYGVEPPTMAHSALADARATAQLLLTLLADEPRVLSEISSGSPIGWPRVSRGSANPLTRLQVQPSVIRRPDYIDELLLASNRAPPRELDDRIQAEYWGLLDRVLEDRLVTPSEGQQLIELANHWGLSASEIVTLHDEYLVCLVSAAKSDEFVTDAERRDLERVGTLLGIASTRLTALLDQAPAQSQESLRSPPTQSMPDSLAGQRVCFTGECQCTYGGEPIYRERAEMLVSEHGLVYADSVTKKLDILVVADPDSLSGKAKKARKYGIRIVHEPVFWRMLGLEVG